MSRLWKVLSTDSERKVESIFNAQDRVEVGPGQGWAIVLACGPHRGH